MAQQLPYINELNLATRAGVAEMLGVTRQRVGQLLRDDEFVWPVYYDGKVTIWIRDDVQQWGERNGYITRY